VVEQTPELCWSGPGEGGARSIGAGVVTMSLFRSLSGFISSAFETTPPIIVAASRSLSLSSTDDTPPASTSATSSTSTSTPAGKPEVTWTSVSKPTATNKPEVKSPSTKSAAASGGERDALPEVDLSHLSVEEREKIAAVLARANSVDATRSDSDVDRQVATFCRIVIFWSMQVGGIFWVGRGFDFRTVQPATLFLRAPLT